MSEEKTTALQMRIVELEKQLGEYAAAEANDPKTWPTALKQMKRIAELAADIHLLTNALEQITRLSPRTMAVSEAQHIAGKALKGSKQ